MFKFSLNWLRDYCGKEAKFEEVLNKLRLQGFEFQGSQNVDDDVITAIEVKANRPDMLSHIGIAREIKAFDGEKIPSLPKYSIKANNNSFPIKIDVNNDVCKRFCALKISGIDTSIPTPNYIKQRLSALGINCVNVVVDLGNYIMLDMGQPVHCYDADKIYNQRLVIDKAESEKKVLTLAQETAEIKPGDIIISDENDIKCIAGVIGADSASVNGETKNLILEAAVFDEVCVRLTSRRLKISTPSSFRFERGVNSSSTLDILFKYAEMITEICGGKIEPEIFDYYPKENKINSLKLSVKNTSRILGINLNAESIISYLEKYDFKCTPENTDIISVKIPSYRLDVIQEIDLIEEVARIHGYDNIKPVMPTIMTQYNKNIVWSNMDIVRNALTGLGFNETINYSFIPSDTMKTFGIEPNDRLYSDLMLQNPIAGAYSLMRPTMVYSLLNCLAYNYSITNNNLALFELGRVYFKDRELDTGCKEIDTCGFIMSGIKIPRGFGSEKDIKYTYYDLLGYLKGLMDKFGQKFKLEKNNYKFLEEGSGYSVIVDDKIIGFIGELDRSRLNKIPNVKLIKDKIFYGELYIKDLSEKVKKIEFESKYPPVKRLYNFLQSKDITAGEVFEVIKSAGQIVRNISVKDIYWDKNMPEDKHAVLYEVNYCSKTSTLTSEEIEKIENLFITDLSKNFNVQLKS